MNLGYLFLNHVQNLFDQIGYIINEYVPELYKLELFKSEHILYIIENSTNIDNFKYVNLKYLKMKYFVRK